VSDEEYNGEFRYVNLGPRKIRARLEQEGDPVEREALELALAYWASKAPPGSGSTEAGEPYRGDKREAVQADSMLALGRAVKPVEHVFVRGELKAEGLPQGEGDLIDFDMLNDE
jgi:hypothetical protein